MVSQQRSHETLSQKDHEKQHHRQALVMLTPFNAVRIMRFNESARPAFLQPSSARQSLSKASRGERSKHAQRASCLFSNSQHHQTSAECGIASHKTAVHTTKPIQTVVSLRTRLHAGHNTIKQAQIAVRLQFTAPPHECGMVSHKTAVHNTPNSSRVWYRFAQDNRSQHQRTSPDCGIASHKTAGLSNQDPFPPKPSSTTVLKHSPRF